MMASSRAAAVGDLGATNQVRRVASRWPARCTSAYRQQACVVVPHAARILVDQTSRASARFFWISSSLSTCSWFSATAKRALGMVDDVGHLLGHRVLVDRHRHAAQRLRRRHRPVEPRAVVADHDQPVAAAEAQSARPAANRRDLVATCAQLGSARCRIPFRDRPAAGLVRARSARSLGNVSRASVAGSAVPVVIPSLAPWDRLDLDCWWCGVPMRQIATVNLRRSSWPRAAGAG